MYVVMEKKQNLGFTLIELLVVISIIGILASLALVSFTAAQKQARDAQRKNDLKQYQTALEAYANKNTTYVLKTSVTEPSSLCETLIGTISCPVDPKTADGFSYRYCTDSNATKFVLWASLENTSGYWVVCSTGKSAISTQAPGCGGGFDCRI
jgi:prepilin-type N-terminal cleavage/methylation domain-containing protein